MGRRSVLFLCLVWGVLLGALAWALSTQLGWVMGNKPIHVKRPAEDKDIPEPEPKQATGVVGAITDDTREAMGTSFASRSRRATGKKASPPPPPASR